MLDSGSNTYLAYLEQMFTSKFLFFGKEVSHPYRDHLSLLKAFGEPQVEEWKYGNVRKMRDHHIDG